MMTNQTLNDLNEKISSTVRWVKRYQKRSFPTRFHELLERINLDDLGSDIVSWMPHGRAFRVHKQPTFVKDIMPRLFRQTKWASFQRQLHMYGFVRITHGPDKGAYYHKMFLRGQSKLASLMLRSKVKGTKVRTPGNPDTEPDFYAMPYVENDFHQKCISSTSTVSDNEINESVSSASLVKSLVNYDLYDEFNAGINQAEQEFIPCQDHFPSIPDDPEQLEAMAADLGTPFSVDHLNELPQDEAGWNYLLDQKKGQQQSLSVDFAVPSQVATI